MTSSDVPVFTTARQFDAAPDKVYDAWADPVKMAQWSGPKGAKVDIVSGTLAAGQSTISRTTPAGGDPMYSLCLWRDLVPHTRVAWEQSFCTPEGVKCAPPFFNEWPLTLLTEVTLVPRDGGTFLTLTWTPIEYDDAGLAKFAEMMASMAGGWGGSFDKLAEWLAEQA